MRNANSTSNRVRARGQVYIFQRGEFLITAPADELGPQNIEGKYVVEPELFGVLLDSSQAVGKLYNQGRFLISCALHNRVETTIMVSKYVHGFCPVPQHFQQPR